MKKKDKDPREEDVEVLVREYADADWSDTFVSYNNAITLAKEVRRLRRALVDARRARPVKLETFKITDADISAIITAARCDG